ncbi:MAG: hypothetical protein QOC93_2985 [Actinomycetota bacterium]|jgi:hypothetical protein|nr:hypothetical protein [Actinomycetota bacterium]
MAEIPIASQLLPGRGLSSDTGRVFATALTFDDPAPEPGQGQTVWFEMLSISSSRQLSENLNIAASASFKMGIQAAAEFNLATSKDINNYHFYALIRCRVVNAPRLIRNAVLKKDAATLLVQYGWESFASQYGWEFVDGIQSGGSYFALLEVQTSSEQQKRDVGAKLGAYFGPFELSSELKSTMKSVADIAAINVSVTRSGGSGEIVHTTVDKMLEEAANFPATAKAEPVNILALTADYRSAIVMPHVPPPDSLPRAQQRKTLEDLGKAYMRLRDYKASVEFVLDHFADFDDFRDLDMEARAGIRKQFQQSLDETRQEIDLIVGRASGCADDFNQCQTYVPGVVTLPLPTIGGEMLNLRQMEEKLAVLEERLAFERNGSLTVPGRVATSGLPANPRNTGWAGGIRTVDLEAEGSIWSAGGVHAGGDTTVGGALGTAGRDPHAGLPPGWGGGVHTWDVYAGSVVAAGPPGGPAKAWLRSDGGAGFEGNVGIRGGGIASWSGGGLGTFDLFAKGAVYVGGDPEHPKCAFYPDGRKTFIIDHPLDPQNRSLVHGCLEGPENAVYYRGESRLEHGRVHVQLPDYFEALARPDGRTVMLTPSCDADEACSSLAGSSIRCGGFEVRALDGANPAQRFYWEVKAVRADVDALKCDIAKGSLGVKEERLPRNVDDDASLAASRGLGGPGE